MLTTDELRDLLAADVAAPPHNIDRTSQVRGRVSATRRRRAVASGLATIAVVAVASLVVVPRLGGHEPTVTPVTPSPSTPADTPLPDYDLGGVLIAQSQNIGSGTFRVPFTAMNKHLSFTVDCYVPGHGDGATMVSIELNGIPLTSMPCNESGQFSGSSSFNQEPAGVDAVKPGHPGFLLVSFGKPVPEQSRVRIGIYEQVPLASYPFPDAPDPLPALDLYGNLLPPNGHQFPLTLVSAGQLPAGPAHRVRVGPTGTWSGTVTLNKGLDIESQTVAPGELHFLVDGEEVGSHFGWDYDISGSVLTLSLAELGIQKGDTVTVTVRAERFPGSSWAVLFSDEKD